MPKPPAKPDWKRTAAAASALEAENARLKAERDTLAGQLSRARGGHREHLYVSTPRRPSKDDLVRVVIPDSHGAHIARHAAAALLADIQRLDPDEIVMLGDHLDCGGFLAQHQTMGFVAETDYSYEDDVRSCNEFLDHLLRAAPTARIHYLEGNHEQRIERWCVTQALRQSRDAAFLLRTFGPEAVLRLGERGITYYRTSGRYHDLPVPGTIKLGQCTFCHGISYATHAAHVHAQRFGISVVYGHTHRSQSTILRTVGGGLIGAWSPGCLSQLQPLWQATRPTDWSHGYGVQLVARSGRFLHLNVPIIDGQSLLTHLPLKESL